MKRVIFPVLGGIGNQLFQLSALVNLSPSYERIVDSNLFLDSPNFSKIRVNELQIGNILGFKEFRKVHRLSRWFLGLLLRFSAWASAGINRRVFYSILIHITQLILARRYGSKVSLLVLSDVGYSQISIPEDSKSLVILGYCQSYKYHSSIELLRNYFELNSNINERIGFSPVELAKKDLPLVVHIRRGDYLFNPQLGVLSQNYYLENIAQVLMKTQAKSIWVFTNELEPSLAFIPENYRDKYRVMNFDNVSDFECFEMMKLGHAFLIANSSFSWWAAYLSKADSKNIYAPEPWFSGLPTPLDLYPPEWRRLRSDFSSTEVNK